MCPEVWDIRHLHSTVAVAEASLLLPDPGNPCRKEVFPNGLVKVSRLLFGFIRAAIRRIRIRRQMSAHYLSTSTLKDFITTNDTIPCDIPVTFLHHLKICIDWGIEYINWIHTDSIPKGISVFTSTEFVRQRDLLGGCLLLISRALQLFGVLCCSGIGAVGTSHPGAKEMCQLQSPLMVASQRDVHKCWNQEL